MRTIELTFLAARIAILLYIFFSVIPGMYKDLDYMRAIVSELKADLKVQEDQYRKGHIKFYAKELRQKLEIKI